MNAAWIPDFSIIFEICSAFFLQICHKCSLKFFVSNFIRTLYGVIAKDFHFDPQKIAGRKAIAAARVIYRDLK